MDGAHRQYIGDGVYAWFDGYQIWLETQRETAVGSDEWLAHGSYMTHTIALDHNTFEALFHYGHTLGFTVKDLTNGS